MPLHVNGLMQAESKRNIYRVTLSATDKPDDLLAPEWWVHVAKQLRLDDMVEVIALDRSWFGTVTVLEVGKAGHGGARVAYVVGPVKLANAAEVAKQADHEVRWGGPNAQWQVVRVRDKLVVKAGLAKKEDAGTWIADNLKAA
ncbi:hypothetical protein [Mesorhizobium sp.]|uniref:hypothetical protein n=1 Tax=Mesorhizobium sp. TaxID=1871066 RepID=UPI000FEA3A96|nr:hypothetical protein [Mesorhizobium sp.]RWF71868.1 MAG: hypothetical protein EOQ34_13925 [Mesorhizobium sp.]TIN03878.1 MAG: hypothetical protein E5Y38_06360 [Mesorhizobium sp.]TIQ95489.1 MAG: hypothetical protein E5X36_21825 [Mesorhizobium sp.]